MRTRLIFTGLAMAALLVATGGSPVAASTAVDTTGPTIGMQPYGHILVGAPVTCSPGYCLFNVGIPQVFETTAQVKWTVSDLSGVCDNQVWNDYRGGPPYLLADVGKATSYNLPVGDIVGTDGADYNYSSIEIRSMDCAGNWTISGYNCTDPTYCAYPSQWPFPPTDRAMDLPENFNGIQSYDDNGATYSLNAWTHSTGAVFMGGSDIHAVKAGASMAYLYQAGVFAWVGEKGPTRGSAKIYQDGILKATVSEYAAVNTGPVIIWSNYFPAQGLHTIKVVVVGTAGHPRVDVDGFFTGPY